MSKNKITTTVHTESNLIEVKSKFDAEFRRWSFKRNDELQNFEQFSALIERLHKLSNIQFLIMYIDPSDNDLLPINNDDNFGRALKIARPLLRIIVQRKGDLEDFHGYGTLKPRTHNPFGILLGQTPVKSKPTISQPLDFHQVSAIIDVDIVPETHRRVRLLKHGSDKPLGFYIRDGTSVRATAANGYERHPGIFISRLVAGGLAESTGLLAVNDEVIEVNGIEVAGKTLDQVTDMMVANSSNLIITVKPANQRTLTTPRRGSFSRNSQLSSGSHQTNNTNTSDENEQDDQDEVVDLTGMTLDEPHGSTTTVLNIGGLGPGPGGDGSIGSGSVSGSNNNNTAAANNHNSNNSSNNSNNNNNNNAVANNLTNNVSGSAGGGSGGAAGGASAYVIVGGSGGGGGGSTITTLTTNHSDTNKDGLLHL